ncbi:TPA: hypothetical protein ACFP41_000441 [Neisseria weaveri]
MVGHTASRVRATGNARVGWEWLRTRARLEPHTLREASKNYFTNTKLSDGLLTKPIFICFYDAV